GQIRALRGDTSPRTLAWLPDPVVAAPGSGQERAHRYGPVGRGDLSQGDSQGLGQGVPAMTRFGEIERFALEFELVPDPDAAGDPALRASWGRLRIWVGGRNLTRGSIPEGDRVSDAECPLLPIAEWLIDHWDPMLHEERLPTPIKVTSSAAWYTRS